MSKFSKSIMQFCFICLSVVFFISCASIKTGTHYNEKYFFENYKTFSWASKEPIVHDKSRALNVSPLTLNIIVASIQDELQEKGYQYVEDTENADFSLSYTVGSREVFSIESYPVFYRKDWSWYWSGRYHHINEWHVKSWTNGTLTVDIFDNKIKEPIWHGWATKAINKKDRKDPSESIRMAVRKIFDDFPSINN